MRKNKPLGLIQLPDQIIDCPLCGQRWNVTASTHCICGAYHDPRQHLSVQAIQIAGLLASNKEWGEKYLAVELEMLDYRAPIKLITQGWWFVPDDLAKQARELLEKYSSLVPENNPLADHDRELKHQTIDSLYQQIKALGVEFEPAAREVFHQAMNAL